MSEQAFDGVRVVELAQWVFVPVAGAFSLTGEPTSSTSSRPRVIPTAAWPPRGSARSAAGSTFRSHWPTGASGPSHSTSGTRAGLAVLQRLLESADVFLTNLRPKALGAARARRRRRSPSATRAGLRPRTRVRRPGSRRRPGRVRRDGVLGPRRNGAHLAPRPTASYPIGQRGAMGDRNGALALAFGMSAALLKRTRTGAGSIVDVSLLATAMWTLSSDLLAALGGDEPKASSGRGPLVNPLVGAYRTKDGRHIQLVFLAARPVLGRLLPGHRSPRPRSRTPASSTCRPGARTGRPVAELDDEFAKRTFDEWKSVLARLDAPWAPVQSVAELLDDPQVEANGYVGDVVIDGETAYRLPAVPVQFDGAATRAAPGPRARRGHRGAAARTWATAGTRSAALKEAGVVL